MLSSPLLVDINTKVGTGGGAIEIKKDYLLPRPKLQREESDLLKRLDIGTINCSIDHIQDGSTVEVSHENSSMWKLLCYNW